MAKKIDMKAKKVMVAVSLRSESGDDYLFLFKAGPKKFASMVKASLGEEFDYCHLVNLCTADKSSHDVYLDALEAAELGSEVK